MPTTMSDIAKALGISKMTVSRVINNLPTNAKTRNRVLAMAEQLNYRPNQHARALATNRSHLLGLAVPDLMHSYFAEIAKAIEAEAGTEGYDVVICNTEEDAASELREVEALRHRTDGLIIASAVPHQQAAAYRKMIRDGAKVVLIDRPFENLPCPLVTTDNVRVGKLATEHLIERGHRRIGHLCGQDGLMATERLEGYKQALAAHGLRYDASLVRECGFFEAGGYNAVRAWIKAGNLPTAIFAVNDPAAIGAMRALEEAKIKVPRDVALVGAGAIHYGDLLRVPLSTVSWNKAELGRQAARLLFDLLAKSSKRSAKAPRVVIEPELIVRKSSGAAGR